MSKRAPEKTIEEVILGIEQKVFASIQQKDAESFAKFLAEEFVYRTPDGSELSREEFLRNVASLPIEIRSISGEHQKVRSYGDVAILTGVQRAEWYQADIAEGGEGAEGISFVAFTDVFVRREGRWLMVLAYGVELPG